jgi:hypothetical protein
VAQEASAEVTVAGVGCERKKKKLQRREKGWKEKRERVAVAAWWPFSGCDGFLWWSWCSGKEWWKKWWKKWWQCWLLVAEEERKRCRRRESAERRGKTSRWLRLSMVRIWAHGEAETPSVGGGGMFPWGLQVAEEAAGREREERTLAGRKNRGEADFLAYFRPDFLLPQAIKSTSIYRRWKRAILSTMEKNLSL